ncbi:TonB family protein [Mucilaginibacter sp. 14171R-50]|uniref:energy transducer TonB n=1 Tax=Mucilaginibacter sp. 14171R-50 TaxID=2703789 RepID=UPI00138CC58B|nr:TonB family protein [Mucilaginibacter sp. 14171R-50]QHS57074.1 TonB family protein [Mucilaginibacter sp. 14171R-50]
MKAFWILVSLLFAADRSFSQSQKKDSTLSSTITNCVFVNDPQFPGGEAALLKYFSKNIKHPKIDKPLRRIILAFFIEVDGKLTNARILRSSDNTEIDKEVLRIAAASPKWSPATTGGKTIRVQYSMPLIIETSSE